MSKKKASSHRPKTTARRPIATSKRDKVTSKWSVLAAAGIAVAGAVIVFSLVAQPRQPAILVQKCTGKCHSVSKLTALNLDPTSAATAVDKMIGARRVTLTPAERTTVINALSRR